ncbi:MAG: hypothetical protein M5U30_05715 [Burkholderiaceae bacterium]|nr:hypothetical protein [Burkholderiaceae bacterium]
MNKADLPLAARTARDLETAPGLRHRVGWTVPVLSTVATDGKGVAALVDALDRHARAGGIGRRLRGAPAAPGDGGAPATDDELFEHLQRWRAAGKGVALATVVRTRGSSPRAEGSHLAVEEGGGFVGSVSGAASRGR